MDEETSKLDEGDIHDVLRNDRRREMITFLSQHDRQTTIRELSEHIATIESGESPPPRNVRQSVYVSLHQTHLPKLESLGVVRYDPDSKDIQTCTQIGQVKNYMNRSDITNEWGLVYMGIGILGVLSIVIGMSEELDVDLLLLALFLSITVMAGYQTIYSGKLVSNGYS